MRAASDRPRLILEIKPASPSAGALGDVSDLPQRLALYHTAAIGFSVLTEPHHFGGSYALLADVASQSCHPVLCKDFIVEPSQLDAARAFGAEAALLIVKSLSDDGLASLTARCRHWGMTPVIEVQNPSELARALATPGLSCGEGVLLVNNRDLDSLAIDLATTSRLAALIPPGTLTVSASGIETRADLDALRPYCDGFLIGSALMRQPVTELAAMLSALTDVNMA